MLTNINDLPVELLLHIFSQLSPADMAQAGRVCRDWERLLSDDSGWERAFRTFFGRHPDIRLDPSSWKGEYVLRRRMMSHWTDGMLQKIVRCKTGQLEQIGGGALSLSKDGRPVMMLAGKGGILTTQFQHAGKISRSLAIRTVGYYQPVMSPSKRYIAMVTKDTRGREVVELWVRRPTGTSKRVIMIDPGLRDGGLLPRWDGDRLLIISTGFDGFQMAVHEGPHWLQAAHLLEIPHRLNHPGEARLNEPGGDQIMTFGPQWILCRTGLPLVSSFEALRDIRAALRLSPRYALVHRGDSWHIFDSVTQQSQPVARPGDCDLAIPAPIHTWPSGDAHLICRNSAGWQWLAYFNTSATSLTQIQPSFTLFEEGYLQDPTEDVFFTENLVFVVRGQVLLIHSLLSLRLLFIKTLLSKQMKFDQPPRIRIVDVLESRGLVLISFNGDFAQIWNFGRLQGCFEVPAKPVKAAEKKASVNSEMYLQYSDWRREVEEEKHLNLLRSKLNPEGMSEQELVQLAISMSLSMAPNDGSFSRAESYDSFTDLTTDDEDLRRVLQLSRLEK